MKAKTGRKAKSTAAGLALSLAVSQFVTLVVTAFLTKIVLQGNVQEESVGYGIMALLILASFAGAITASKSIQRRKAMMCIASGLLYWLSLLSVTALFFGGRYEAAGVTAVLILGGCGTAAIMECRESKHEKCRAWR